MKREEPHEWYSNRIKRLRKALKDCRDDPEIRFVWRLVSFLSPKIRKLNRLRKELWKMYYHERDYEKHNFNKWRAL